MISDGENLSPGREPIPEADRCCGNCAGRMFPGTDIAVQMPFMSAPRQNKVVQPNQKVWALEMTVCVNQQSERANSMVIMHSRCPAWEEFTEEMAQAMAEKMQQMQKKIAFPAHKRF